MVSIRTRPWLVCSWTSWTSSAMYPLSSYVFVLSLLYQLHAAAVVRDKIPIMQTSVGSASFQMSSFVSSSIYPSVHLPHVLASFTGYQTEFWLDSKSGLVRIRSWFLSPCRSVRLHKTTRCWALDHCMLFSMSDTRVHPVLGQGQTQDITIWWRCFGMQISIILFLLSLECITYTENPTWNALS